MILFPKSHEAYSNISRILLETGQYDLAETYLIKVIDLKPDFLMAYQNLFNLYLQTKQQDKAEKTIFKCLKLAPNNHLINSNLGRFLLEKGDLYKSRKYLEKAINLLEKEDRSSFKDFVNSEISFNPHNMFICKSQKILNKYYMYC